MENLVYKKFLEIKYQNCLGCVFDYSSQKDHDCCMDNSSDFFYLSQALNYYKNRGELGESEALNILKNWYKKHGEMYF